MRPLLAIPSFPPNPRGGSTWCADDPSRFLASSAFLRHGRRAELPHKPRPSLRNSAAMDDQAVGRIVGRHCNRHVIAGNDLDVEAA